MVLYLSFFSFCSLPTPGYVVKDLHLEHSWIVAEKWISERRKYCFSWYLDITSFQQRLQFGKDLIQRYGAIGAFTEDNPSQPVSWTLRKSGMLVCHG